MREADGTVRLSSVGSRRLAERLVAQLPDVRPGAGAPVVVSRAELWATNREVLRVRELLALPTTGAGELYASGSKPPLCYVDTAAGRNVITTVGADTVRVGPAHQPALVAHLNGIRLGA